MEIAGQKISVPVEGRLTTTQAQIKSSESDWQRVLASYGSEQLKEIPATGKKAVWSERRGQLSVQGEKHIYHVAVEGVESPLSPMEVAAKVALQLIDQFN
jgi:cytochrome c5